MKKRPEPVAFSFQTRHAFSDTRYKIHADGAEVELYDLEADLTESNNIADERPRILKQLSEDFRQWEKTLRE